MSAILAGQSNISVSCLRSIPFGLKEAPVHHLQAQTLFIYVFCHSPILHKFLNFQRF